MNYRGIRQICLAVTDRCNARCRQCFIWKRPPREPFSIKELDMVFQNSDLSSLESISVSGGEPVLREDIVGVLRVIRRYYKKHLIVQSNCFLPDRLIEVVTRFKDISVCCSLDGLKGIHDQIRGVPNGFDKVIESMTKLKQHSVPFLVSMTIQKANENQIMDVYGIAKKFGVPFWCRPAGTGYFFNKGTQGTSGELDKVLVIRQLESIKDVNPMWIQVNIWYLKQGQLPFKCSAGKTSCLIMPNLDVFPCSHCPHEWKLGNLREVNYNLNKILTDKYSKNCRKCINEIAHPLIIPTLHHFVASSRSIKIRLIKSALTHPLKACAELVRSLRRL